MDSRPSVKAPPSFLPLFPCLGNGRNILVMQITLADLSGLAAVLVTCPPSLGCRSPALPCVFQHRTVYAPPGRQGPDSGHVGLLSRCLGIGWRQRSKQLQLISKRSCQLPQPLLLKSCHRRVEEPEEGWGDQTPAPAQPQIVQAMTLSLAF